MNPYTILAAVCLAIASTAGGYAKGRADANTTWSLRVAESERKAAEEGRALQEKTNAIVAQLQSEKDAVSGRLADALVRLRQRPERLPSPSRPTCKGATGAELSGPDAEFLVREAARADRLRAAADACFEWAKQIRR